MIYIAVYKHIFSAKANCILLSFMVGKHKQKKHLGRVQKIAVEKKQAQYQSGVYMQVNL